MAAKDELRWLRRLDQAVSTGDARGELNALKMLDSIRSVKRGPDASRLNPAESLPSWVPDALKGDAMGAAMIAAGESSDRLLTGARNLVSGGGDESLLAGSTRQERQSIMDPLRERHGVATAVGEALPYFAIPTGAAAGTVGRGAALLGAKETGKRLATSGLLDAAAVGALGGGLDVDGSAAMGALGGAGGNLIGRGAGRLLRPFSPALREGQERALQAARKLGFRTTPAQASGSAGGQRFEAAMKGSPWSAGTFLKDQEFNQTLANKIAARAIGESADSIDDVVRGRAAERIGSMFDDVASKHKTIRLDDTFLDDLAKVDAEVNFGAWAKIDESVNDVIDNALDAASKGKITAAEYKRIATNLRRAAQKELETKAGDREAGIAIFKIKDALDDAMQRSLSPEDAAKFKEARGLWKNLVMIESPGVVNQGTGDISLPKLANRLARMDKGGFSRGKNNSDLYEAARFGQAFKEAVGDSGTSTRMSLRDLGNSVSRGVSGGGILGAFMGEPVTGMAAGGALAASLPAAAMGGSALYNSPIGSAYMRQGLLPLTEGGRGLLGKAGQSLGIGLLGSP